MAKMPVLVGLGGSLRQRSFSAAALSGALHIGEAEGASVELLDLRELNLPVYDPDREITGYPDEHQSGIARLLAVARSADVMIWSSATYHGTITGALKNALDFLEFMSEDRPPYLEGRAVGLIVLSDPSTFGAMIGAVHELRAWLAPTRIVVSRDDFAPDLALSNPAVIRRMTRLVKELLSFASRRDGRS